MSIHRKYNRPTPNNKILITGASGFVGSHLLKRLLANGDLIRCSIHKNSLNIPCEVESLLGDLTDPIFAEKLTEGINCVFHCAALVSGAKSKEQYFEVNTAGTEILLGSCVKNNISRFIFISTLGVLGLKDHIGVDESAKPELSFDPYRDSKMRAEEIVLKYGEKLKITILRPGWIYGPGDQRILPFFVRQIKRGTMIFPGMGNNLVHFTYIDHVIEAIMRARQQDRTIGQVYNITDGTRVTFRQILETLASIMKKKRSGIFIPKSVAILVGFLCELLERILHVPVPIKRYHIRLLNLNHHFSIAKAERDFGYKPTVTLEEGLQSFYRWYCENY